MSGGVLQYMFPETCICSINEQMASCEVRVRIRDESPQWGESWEDHARSDDWKPGYASALIT